MFAAFLRRWRRRLSRAEWEVRRLRLSRSQAAGDSPGLLLIQVDGLGRSQFERAVKSGRMPFCARLLRREGGDLRTFYSGQPATTPAVQGELYYGVSAAVPAFSFLDPRAGELGMMMQPTWAKRIEADLAADDRPGLLAGGSSWSNIYTGGAGQQESHFCGASLAWSDLWRTGKIRHLFLFAFLHFPVVLRLLALLPLEFVLSLADAVRGIWAGQSIRRELLFVLARVFVCVGLREMVALGAKIDLARGLPVIHVNFLGYDEQSHRRGPDSRFAHWTLRGIDRVIRALHAAARRSDGRRYQVWIFSDHGQVRVTPFSHRVSGGLEAAVRRCWPGLAAEQREPRGFRPRDQSRLAQAAAQRMPLRRRRADDRARLTAFEAAEFVVACMGPVGHVYFRRPLDAPTERQLIRDLLAAGVPGVLQRRAADDVILWHTEHRTAELPRDVSLLRGPEELRPLIAEDLARLVRQPFAGNLVCLGWDPDGRSYSFAEENGSHCGPSPDEVQGFLVLPAAAATEISEFFVRPSALREAALRVLGRSPSGEPPALTPAAETVAQPAHVS